MLIISIFNDMSQASWASAKDILDKQSESESQAPQQQKKGTTLKVPMISSSQAQTQEQKVDF